MLVKVQGVKEVDGSAISSTVTAINSELEDMIYRMLLSNSGVLIDYEIISEIADYIELMLHANDTIAPTVMSLVDHHMQISYIRGVDRFVSACKTVSSGSEELLQYVKDLPPRINMTLDDFLGHNPYEVIPKMLRPTPDDE